MKKVLIMFSVIIFSACQKGISDLGDGGGSSNTGGDSTLVNPLKGMWNFTSISAGTKNTADVSFPGEDDSTLSTINYTSINNSGTLTVSDSVFNMAGYTYSISDTIKSYSYKNDVFQDSLEQPFNYYVPATNSTAKYKLIGTDSVYFPEGGFLSPAQDSTALKPYGLKFNITGNMLTFSQQLNLDTVVVTSGVTQHETATGIGTILFTAK